MVPGASALEGRDDLAEVVSDDTEPGEASEDIPEHGAPSSPDVLRVFLDDPPQGVLGVVRHGVSLVQNYQLVAPEVTGSLFGSKVTTQFLETSRVA